MNKLKIIFILNYLLFTGCSFYSMAGSIPPHIKTVAIPLMNNETAEFGIAEALTDGLLERFNEEGVLGITNELSAHSILRGTVKKVNEGPYTYTRAESVSEYRFKIDVKLEWYDVRYDKNLINGIYSGFGAYGLSGDIASDGIDNDNDGKIDGDDDDEFGEPRVFATNVAVRKIAEDILNDIMTTW
ncbi:MAG: hypothetical protein CMG74_09950 [Candidatus Marinimicrobia bacterium]|nr:hypothetical protein [Candidatus Neomarinimicrobiota bacterium]